MSFETRRPINRAKWFRSKYHLTHSVWVDKDRSAADAFGIDATPTNIVIDKTGFIRYQAPGYAPADIDAVVQALVQQ